MFRMNRKNFTWLIYIPIAVILLYFFAINYASYQFITFGYFYLLFLAIAVSLFPIQIKDEVFSLIGGVSLVAFVIYGLHPELIISSIAVLAVMFKSNVRIDQHHRYALNLLMIAVISIISAGAYFGAGEMLSGFNTGSHQLFLPSLVYVIVYSMSNHLFIYLLQRFYLQKKDVSLFNKHLLFSLRLDLFVFPLSYILIFLYIEMGTWGIVLGSFPFLMISLGYSLWGKDQSHIAYLTLVSRASQKMASEMDMEKVKESFVRSLLEIFPVEQAYYYRIFDDEQVILKRVYSQDQSVVELDLESNLSNNSVLREALKTQAISAYGNAEEWVPYFEYDKADAESAIVLPVHISTKDKGVLVITHQSKSGFDEYLVSLVEVLHQYFITVIENVYHFEELEALHKTDHLTGLYNLRGFSEAISLEIENGDVDAMSMIILDLDHFKRVNDRHGHEAGNEVLIQLGKILKTFKGNNRLMARYGGEEFIVLLKDYSSAEAFALAEAIRQEIESWPFKLNQSIETSEVVDLSVTASFGVATYPDDCADVYGLTQLADEAMALGSKKNGRNRVTAYGGGGKL